MPISQIFVKLKFFVSCSEMEDVLQGKLHNPSEKFRNEVAVVLTTNYVSERVFGSFDSI